jgi:hypothetical protein
MTDPISPHTAEAERRAARSAGTVDWLAVVATLAEADVPAPPAAIGWPQDWYPIASHCFASWPATARPYDLDAVMAEAYARTGERAALLGFDGYGFNSWAMHAIWCRGPLLVGFQTAAGGAFMDAEQSRERIEASWDILSDMVAALARLEGTGRLPAGRRLVVIDSDLRESRWGWIADGTAWDAAAWTVSPIAAFAAVSALERL